MQYLLRQRKTKKTHNTALTQSVSHSHCTHTVCLTQSTILAVNNCGFEFLFFLSFSGSRGKRYRKKRQRKSWVTGEKGSEKSSERVCNTGNTLYVIKNSCFLNSSVRFITSAFKKKKINSSKTLIILKVVIFDYFCPQIMDVPFCF